MKKIHIYLLGLLLLLVSCEKDPIVSPSYVLVEYEQVNATSNSLSIRCNIKSDVNINEVEVEYATTEDDLDSYFFCSSEEMTKSGASYIASLTGLKENTDYYIRYRIGNNRNSVKTEAKKYRTAKSTLPSVTTSDPANVTCTTATLGGNVTSDGGAAVKERGVVYSTSPKPTTSNSKKTSGSGTGSFSVSLSGLSEGTTYYVRAYAINSNGTSYGEQKSFTTGKAGVLSVTTSDPTNVSLTTATVGGIVTSDGGAAVTERGVVYSTSQNPTTSSSKKTLGSGTGSFSVSLSGLSEGTTYYVRAYAINSKGTSYGEQKSFTTGKANIPSVTTSDPTNVSLTTATVGGNVTSDGGAAVTERGVVYSTSQNPTTANSKITSGSGTGSFSISISNLKEGTTYYVRAYAINSKGTSYGEQKSFTTGVNLPSVTTSAATNVSYTIATVGGNVTSDGGAAVTERGVVYSTSQKPTTANSKITSGSGTGSFSVSLSDLSKGTTYYVRAYAINSRGISYGEQKSFTTDANLPSVTTSDPTNVSLTTATLGGNVTSDGGAAVTERGVVYSTSQKPTTANSKITSGSGTGSFSVSLSGLSKGTTYYVRAYAINSKGTRYGEQKSFTTGKSSGSAKEHDYVNLGLSVKWATCNVGADSPEDYGDYFAWGETKPKSTYNWSTYKWCKGSETTLTKYCTNSKYGTVDNKTQLDLSDDAARANWGGSWRMPTIDEFTELEEKCSWTLTTQNGVKGYKVTSKVNGNSIFLPAAGARDDSSLLYSGRDGFYWSSSLYTDSPYNARYLLYSSSYLLCYYNRRDVGQSVRPVCP